MAVEDFRTSDDIVANHYFSKVQEGPRAGWPDARPGLPRGAKAFHGLRCARFRRGAGARAPEPRRAIQAPSTVWRSGRSRWRDNPSTRTATWS